MKKVVIAGSASLLDKVQYWKKVWEDKGYLVVSYPAPIPKENFLEEYPKVHTEFFRNITGADILFVINEDKNGVAGYLGAESFVRNGYNWDKIITIPANEKYNTGEYL